MIRMSDVFISYAHSTQAQARQVAEALRALGHDVWWDEENPLHRPFSAAINEHARDAKAVLVLWSNDALQSDWVHAEADVARQARVLVQVSLDGCLPPIPFNQTPYADLTGWTGDTKAPAWRKVVASVNELVGDERTAAVPVAAAEKRVSLNALAPRKRMFAGLLLGGVAVAIAATWYGLATSSHPARPDAASSETTTTSVKDNTPDDFANRPAIAVLPFENRSDDPKHAIFADGLAESLISRLSAWRAFPVIGRTSSFHYRGDVDIKRVAKELNVRYVVQGSVQREADRIRVSAQLIDAQSGANVWSQTYDRNVADLFDLQDEISASIAAPLVGDLTRAEAKRAQSRGSQNVDAWSVWQLGEQHEVGFTPEDIAAARPFFEQAIALEPQFASAHARLAHTLVWETQFGLATSPKHNLTLALESARRAVALDPLDPLAHDALAFALLISKDTSNGLASAQRAVDLNPSSPEAWSLLGYAKWLAGDPKGCIAANDWALRLDPQSALIPGIYENLSDAYWGLGEYEVGLEYARKILAVKPDYYWAHVDIALNSVGLGRLDEAKAAIDEARRVQPDLSLEMIRQRSGIVRPEIIARHSAALHEAGLN